MTEELKNIKENKDEQEDRINIEIDDIYKRELELLDLIGKLKLDISFLEDQINIEQTKGQKVDFKRLNGISNKINSNIELIIKMYDSICKLKDVKVKNRKLILDGHNNYNKLLLDKNTSTESVSEALSNLFKLLKSDNNLSNEFNKKIDSELKELEMDEEYSL